MCEWEASDYEEEAVVVHVDLIILDRNNAELLYYGRRTIRVLGKEQYRSEC